MKPRSKLLILVLVVLASSQVRAVNSERELQYHASSAKNFLCQRGFCLQRLPPLDLQEVDGYLGYVDGNYSRISISPQLNAAETQLALVHELTHFYRGQKAAAEELWLNEGLAKFIEYQYSTVWPVSYMTKLQNERALNFADYKPGGNGYMSSFFLVLYLYNHFGEEKLFAKLMNSKKTGWDNVMTAIHELIDEQHLRISKDLVNKESILRHFAVALWTNDKFTAEYALFFLDAKYEPLRLKVSSQVRPATAAVTSEAMQIRYAPRAVYVGSSAAVETYSILSYDPFQIKTFEASDRSLVVISLFY